MPPAYPDNDTEYNYRNRDNYTKHYAQYIRLLLVDIKACVGEGFRCDSNTYCSSGDIVEHIDKEILVV